MGCLCLPLCVCVVVCASRLAACAVCVGAADSPGATGLPSLNSHPHSNTSAAATMQSCGFSPALVPLPPSVAPEPSLPSSESFSGGRRSNFGPLALRRASSKTHRKPHQRLYVSPTGIHCSVVAPVAHVQSEPTGVSPPFCFPRVFCFLPAAAVWFVRPRPTSTVLQVQCAASKQATLVAGEACDWMRAATECTVVVAGESF